MPSTVYPGVGQEPLPFDVVLPELSRFQRIDTLPRLEGGFLPTTRTEETEQLGLQSFIDVPGGAARHLAEVAKHQVKAHQEDPLRAARSITRSYIGFAEDAQRSSTSLTGMQEELVDVNPELHMSLVVDETNLGVLAFLRYFDLTTLREQGSIRAVGYDPHKVDYVPENPGITFYAGQALEQWRVHQVRKQLPEAIQDQGRRMSFWLERLVEIDKHYPKLRAVARDGLDKIYGRDAA